MSSVTSARPTSARPTSARPTSARPTAVGAVGAAVIRSVRRSRLPLTLVALAGLATVAATALPLPHALATGVTRVETWVGDRSDLQVFLGILGLLVLTLCLPARAKGEHEERSEWVDVR